MIFPKNPVVPLIKTVLPAYISLNSIGFELVYDYILFAYAAKLNSLILKMFDLFKLDIIYLKLYR